MRDILPSATPKWQFVEKSFFDLMSAYGYQEIRMPIIEVTQLFKRSIGEVTDIVEKEMYSFESRGGKSLTLRPEGTASCVRAGLEHGLLYNQTQKLWYCGPMFRYERPQKGRYRQFQQIGVEVFGYAGPDVDAELIAITQRYWKVLGISEHVKLEINSLGTSESRLKYREQLVMYFSEHANLLDEDSTRRLQTNPLRILDSKEPSMQDLIENAPKLTDALDEESKQHFAEFRQRLDDLGIKYEVNPKLVRGLDYYNLTVFEWVTDKLGAQSAVCAGGRYDGLVEQLGGKASPAVGFAMGIDRLTELLECVDSTIDDNNPHVYVVLPGEEASRAGALFSEQLRDEVKGLRLVVNAGAGNFKKQMKRANNSGADLVLIIAENEMSNNTVSIKYLRTDDEQVSIAQSECAAWLNEYIK